jgi:hypothetical protein
MRRVRKVMDRGAVVGHGKPLIDVHTCVPVDMAVTSSHLCTIFRDSWLTTCFWCSGNFGHENSPSTIQYLSHFPYMDSACA